MDFYNTFNNWLVKNGFRLIRDEQVSIWCKMEEDCAILLHIVPERLPGQDRYKIADLYKEQERVCSEFMIKTGRMAECLMLLIFKDMPDQRILKELQPYPNLWCVSRSMNSLLIYEGQRSDFYGLKVPLENYLEEYSVLQEKRNKAELKKSFTPVNTLLVLVNIGVFFVLSCLGNVNDPEFMTGHGAMVLERIVEYKEYYRIFTSMFLHFGVDHLFQNMLILLIMGCRLERITGSWQYLLIYLGSGITGSIASIFFTLKGQPFVVSAGASGAIFGVLGGILGLILVDLVKKQRQRIRNIGLTGVIFMICAALSYGFFETGVDNAAHIGGLIGGFVLTAAGALLRLF